MLAFHTYTPIQEPFPNITSFDATTRRYLRVCADLSCLKKTHACISLSQQSCCLQKKKKEKTLIAKSIYYSFQLLCEHRGARNLHSSPPLMHCCVMLRPNWNVGDYFMFHGTKGLKTIRKIIFSSLLVVFIHSFTMWVAARGVTWRQAINKLAASPAKCDSSAWSIAS